MRSFSFRSRIEPAPGSPDSIELIRSCTGEPEPGGCPRSCPVASTGAASLAGKAFDGSIGPLPSTTVRRGGPIACFHCSGSTSGVASSTDPLPRGTFSLAAHIDRSKRSGLTDFDHPFACHLQCCPERAGKNRAPNLRFDLRRHHVLLEKQVELHPLDRTSSDQPFEA